AASANSPITASPPSSADKSFHLTHNKRVLQHEFEAPSSFVRAIALPQRQQRNRQVISQGISFRS
ncbi:MAG: hypothetical protein J1F25_08170, partial [Prevotellaceae bacterium]|nr:hypothetical protein [Prevotellaceae bacterium]